MFEVGQRVRIRETAFPGCDEPPEATVRGMDGEIIGWRGHWNGENLWWWQSDDGRLDASVTDSELELVEK